MPAEDVSNRHKSMIYKAFWAMPPLAVVIPLALLSRGLIPAGVPGEWTWNAPAASWTIIEAIPAILTTLLVLALSAIGSGTLARPLPRMLAVSALMPAIALIQAGWQLAAPAGYGLAKWPIATYNAGSSGYFSLARDQITDPGQFLSDYPAWILEQDVLHTGTHPPGLFIEARMVFSYWSDHVESAAGFVARLPRELREAARSAHPAGTPPVEQATVLSLAIIRWLACALTVWPLYGLMRRLGHEPLRGYRTALFWGVVPSAVLFQPASDLLFPVLATSAVALAVKPGRQTSRWRNVGEPCLAGMFLGLGMFFSLVFLGVGAVVAGVIVSTPSAEMGWRGKLARIAWVGCGFLLITTGWAIAGRTDPLAIWLANQAKHAGFYAAYPRSYGPWLVANLAEMAFGIGLPLFVCVGVGFVRAIAGVDRPQARVALATLAILAILALSGRSLSEVGRLWLPFFPLTLTIAVQAVDSLPRPGLAFRWVVLWCCVEIVWLQTLVQCVYPI